MLFDIDHPRIVDSPELSHYPCDACDDQPGQTRMWIYGGYQPGDPIYVRVATNYIKNLKTRRFAIRFIKNAPQRITPEWIKSQGFEFMHTEH